MLGKGVYDSGAYKKNHQNKEDDERLKEPWRCGLFCIATHTVSADSSAIIVALAHATEEHGA